MSGDKVVVTERLYLTADQSRVVREGDPAAAFLFATPGKEIALDVAVRYGLVGRKQAAKVADKEADPPADKSGSGLTVKRGAK